ncbi:unnamed protein product [Meloidogyne enterolobii]|uniref:Uncharacterized protein n=1 Tax=Meloidogyne enterolobii TaxID=390850 RepID=A0ACB0ZYK8_MELEN
MKNKILICFLLLTTIFVLIHGIGNTKIETNNSEVKLESPKQKPLIPKNSTHKNVKNSQTKASAKVKPEEERSQTEIEKKEIKQKSDSKSKAGVNMSDLKRVLSAGVLSYKAKGRNSENFWNELNVDKSK